jgi:hypothetical protein
MYQSDNRYRDGADEQLSGAQTGEDVPRWLVILGLAAGLTLFVALLRYAIDLLGVVFVITLVGFALRTLSDWLTEGESVSGWAMSAVSVSLIGTMLVGVWLFNSGGSASEIIGRRLPGPVQRSVAWLERQGWGQRVLLPGGSLSNPAPLSTPASAPASAGPGGRAPGAPSPAAPAIPVPRMLPPAAPSPARASRPSRQTDIGAAEAATVPAPVSAEPASGPSGAPAALPSGSPAGEAERPLEATSLALVVSPDRPVVGTSVRLTATLSFEAGAAPGGRVAFYDGERLIGRAALRRAGNAWQAFLVTLDLELGEHALRAVYDGDATLASSQSPHVPVTVARR